MAQLAMFGVAARLAPSELLAQAPTAAQRFGKDKLIIRSMRPPDFETPVALLDSFITPNELFYVRSHMPVPQVDASAWALKIGGEVNSPISLTLDEIKKLPAVTITATLECAGNGRAFFEPALAGIQWEKGAVGTARFTGARMSDVLKKHMQVDDELDEEVRRRIKNLQEGTSTWEVEYGKVLDQIKRNRGLDQ